MTGTVKPKADISLTTREGGKPRNLTAKQRRELVYLLLRHSSINQQSKLLAIEKEVTLQQIQKILGLDVERVELPKYGGLLSMNLDESEIDRPKAKAIIGEEVAEIAKERGLFFTKASLQLLGKFSNTKEYIEKLKLIKAALPEGWVLGEAEYSSGIAEKELRQLCREYQVPYPAEAIVPKKRSPRWRRPASCEKTPRRSPRLKNLVQRKLDEEERIRSR